MEIDYDIRPYAVFQEVAIATALQQIDANNSQIVFTVDAQGRLTGVMTDGDFRRWLQGKRNVDTSQPVSQVANKNVATGRIDGNPEEWNSLFSKRVRVIPLVDGNGQLHAIARPRRKSLQIGNRRIGRDAPAYIVAEIGNNHNGDMDRARQLVDEAVAAGADCAKFQIRQLDAVYRNASGGPAAAEDLGAEYTLDLLRKYALSNDDLFRIFDYCHAKGIEPLCTPWDADSVALLESYGMNAYKVASPDLTNHDLLRRIAAVRRPMIVSTGMSREEEIRETVQILRRAGAGYALLHCNSTYPTPVRDINLAYMDRLHEIGKCPVGYSGHERGIHIAFAAIARGARIVEKHVTLDRTLEGSDHKFSLLPHELGDLVAGIRDIEQAIGNADPRTISQGELLNRSNLGKSLVARCDIAPGAIITDAMLDVRSPGQGLQPNSRKDVVGRRAKTGIAAGAFIFLNDIDHTQPAARRYRFARPWGIPVRYHDWRALAAASNPDLVEFHLSYRDLEIDFREYIDDVCALDLVVHCPELFADDHILDLCSPSESYRARSVRELQRVIDLTRDLATRFRKSARTPVVVNLGGFSEDGPLDAGETERRFEMLYRSLDTVEPEGVELLPQTMPPFPWHFGGQRYHNVLVDPDDILRLCAERRMRICLDVSHAMLASAHLGLTLDDYVARAGQYIGHLHIADASGADREGLQIGEGAVNFGRLARQLKRLAPRASFIPEIWQGHAGKGQGFWTALDRLEPIFDAADAEVAIRPAARPSKRRGRKSGVRSLRAKSAQSPNVRLEN